MSTIYTIAAQKGGTSKSTTAAALATGFRLQGLKTLAIDLDPQANLTYFMGGDANALGAYEFMTGTPAGQIIQHCKQGDIIPANLRLAELEAGKPTLLQAAIKPIKNKYDVIIIDNAPTLGALLINGLMAATDIIIPLKADATALQSLYQLADTIKAVQSKNEALKVAGIVVTQYSKRTCLARDLLEAIQEKSAELGYRVFNTQIRTGVAVQEAQLMRASLFEYAPASNPATDYNNLIEELKNYGKEL